MLRCILFASAFLQTALLGFSSKRQLKRIRQLYFEAIMRQDVSWFDRQSTGALINKLSQNVEQIELGIGTKLGEFAQNISGFIAGIVIAFSVGWKLSLVACAILPLVVLAFSCFGFLMKFFTVKELAAYARAGTISGEVLSTIRTVVAFGGEKKEFDRYHKELSQAESVGIKKSTAIGGVAGFIGLSIFGSAALIFWYGFKLKFDEAYDPGAIVLVFINVLMGSIYLGNALPNFQHFMNAKASAQEIYGTIQRIPKIDKTVKGVVLPTFTGNISFTEIDFSYPSRPDIQILKNFNLNLKSGQTVALVGPSGSGKSTIVHMLQRFYDPTRGHITVEDVNIQDLDLRAFRSQLGSVQQEPVLFEGTIADNIRMGKLDATQEDIEEAAKQANAHSFILEQPNGYDTVIGERGSGMSGGQKQRLAIARALIRKPKLLLLDEATSALDTKSERIVQEALEKASEGRTVIVVAHRLTTVRNVDLILVLEQGIIRESGTHEELVRKNGLYAAMLRNQKQTDKPTDNESELYDGDTEEESQHNIPQEVWQFEKGSDATSEESRSLASLNVRVSVTSREYKKLMKQARSAPIWRMLKLNLPELPYIIFGCLCCIIAGGVQPAFAVLYSEIYELFTITDRQKAEKQINLISGMMALLGFVRLLAMLGQGYFFGVSGERLTKRVRTMYFESMLKQEIGWFDRPENQAGALTAKLATEASKLKAISGSQVGVVMEAVVLVSASLAISFIYSWQLTLLFLAFFPFIVISGMLQIRSMRGTGKGQDEQGIMRVAQEAISNHRTVFTLVLEDYFYDKFNKVMKDDFKSVVKQCMFFALVYSLTQCITMFAFAAVFALGAYLKEKGMIDVLALFRVFAVMNMGAQSLGRTASFGPEAQSASKSARDILAVLDRKSRIPVNEGLLPNKPFTGKVNFSHVYFRYPARREIRTLTNFSHVVHSGQTVALVGPSGCGKSTLLQLIQRFYDPSNHGPDSGVFFDEWNLRELAPCWIRKQIGIVSQEPNLFDISLRDNIAYGDNSREVPMDEIIEAARQANIHDFIMTLPEGYDTIAGERGSQLSGGQKQRVAIARALLRKPVLLLLDEATSALDNESERIVQEALDAATGSRTSLVVAHRLSTVLNSDLIVVLENGRKIETGPPAALLEMKGAFYALHNAEES